MSDKIRILVCDDHTLFREGIKAILERERSFEVAGEAADGRTAVKKAQELNPDVVLLDIAMPGLGGIEAMTRIRHSNPNIRFVVLTMYDEETLVARCLNAGASAYVLKDAPRAHLIHAIEVAHQGGQYMSAPVLKKVVTGYVKGARTAVTGYDRLSDREKEVLKLLADGLSLKDAASQLGLSVKTVDVHKTNLMRKLDLHSRAELIRYAIEQKLIRLPSM